MRIKHRICMKSPSLKVNQLKSLVHSFAPQDRMGISPRPSMQSVTKKVQVFHDFLKKLSSFLSISTIHTYVLVGVLI